MAIQMDTDKEQNTTRRFNPNDHLIQIKNRNGNADYLPVQFRLVWFREQCPDGVIETEMLHLDLDRETEEEGYAWNNDTRRSEKIVKRANGICVFRAIVKDGKGGVATGTKCEKAASFPDFIEKSETGSIGRALAALGYGTQFAPELDEGNRLADAPVTRTENNPAAQNTNRPITSPQPQGRPTASTTPKNDSQDTLATDQQIKSLRTLRQHLGKPEMTEDLEKKMTYLEAKEAITTLSHEYNERKQQRKAS